MIAGVAVLIIFFIIVSLVGFICYKRITVITRESTGNNIDIDTVKEFLPFEDISNGIIDLGNFKYRMIIECSSINYHLRSSEEQDIIEMSYMRFLHNRNFPIIMHIATRKLDFSKIIKNVKNKSDKVMQEFNFDKNSPFAQLVTDQVNYLKYLENSQTNLQQKRKYIIVVYDLNDKEVSKLNNQEKKEFAENQIFNRAVMIKEDLFALKIEGKILSTKEIIEVLYSAINKENSDLAEAVGTEMFNSIFVDSEQIDSFKNLSSLDFAGMTLSEAINKLSVNFISSQKIQELITKLKELRDEII